MPMSQRFKDTLLSNSRHALTRVTLLRRGEQIDELIWQDGGITFDRTASYHRRLDISPVPLTKWIPGPDGGDLWPFGNEIKVESGLRFADGTEEWIGCGVFRISKPKVTEDQGIAFTLNGYDRGRTVSRDRARETIVIAQNQDLGPVIKNLIEPRLPVTVDWSRWMDTTDIGHTTPRLTIARTDDIWEHAQNLARGGGLECFFDGNGNPVLRLVPDPDDKADWEYVEGEEMTIVGNLGRDLDDEESYNGAIVTAENADGGVVFRSEAWDTNPLSPTYYDPAFPEASVYGPVPYFLTSQYIRTQAQCDAVAAATLRSQKGTVELVDFSALINPAHESGDIVRTTRSKVNIDSNYILDGFTMPLDPTATMSATTRRRQLVGSTV